MTSTAQTRAASMPARFAGVWLAGCCALILVVISILPH